MYYNGKIERSRHENYETYSTVDRFLKENGGHCETYPKALASEIQRLFDLELVPRLTDENQQGLRGWFEYNNGEYVCFVRDDKFDSLTNAVETPPRWVATHASRDEFDRRMRGIRWKYTKGCNESKIRPSVLQEMHDEELKLCKTFKFDLVPPEHPEAISTPSC